MTQQSLRTTLSFHSILALILVAWGALVATTTARGDSRDEDRRPESNTPLRLAALKEHARVTRDAFGVAHVRAENDHDLYFLAGYVHAQDRLFQMDVNRRLGNGTLAELLGEGALTTDVQLRTIGLRRAAERSLAAISPRTRAVLEAYAEGVNACVAAHPLPPEYGGLELTHFEPWTALDSVTVAKLIAFGRSFDLDIEPTVTLLTYQQAGQALGFDGAALYAEDLFRVAPFDRASTVPDASVPAANSHAGTIHRDEDERRGDAMRHLHPAAHSLGRQYLDDIKDLPVFQRILNRKKQVGSNEWGISGAFSENGAPLLANDPHLPLSVPSTFYPIHLEAERINVIGSSFAGVPFVILGHNPHISWGATVNYMDVTDTFQEQVVADASSPSGLSTVYQGQHEPIIPIPEVFRKNNFDGVPDNLSVVPPGGGIPPVTLIVPRRDNGPILKLDLANGIALSVQYTGFSPTRELDAFAIFSEARGLDDFQHGLEFFNEGSINWAYSDVRGNLAYFGSSDLPIREDLQAGVVNGLPPYFIRNGTGGNEWLPVQHLQPGQAVPHEILPASEMPHLINPPAGWFVNANNDPAGNALDNNPLNQLRPGGGIFYLNNFYEGLRAGRITQLIKQKLATTGRISFKDMQDIQADTVLIDAQVFVPYITRALANAQTSTQPALAAFAARPALAEAVGRLSHWDFTTPTGIPEGFDASDINGQRFIPSSAEIASSVSATIYGVWRGQFIHNTIDAPLAPFGLPTSDDNHALPALRNLLDKFPTTGGVGASGVNFFNVPGVASAADRRDILILKSLDDALTRLAGDPFAAAFAHSTHQDDYRWGMLHRVVFSHTLGGPFNIPPAGGLFPPPLPGLDGIPADGGFGTVDAAIHNLRGDNADAFMFDHGPAERFVSEALPGRMHAESSLPGGTSGVLGSPHYFDLLAGWLTNDAFPLLTRHDDVRRAATSITKFAPAN